MHRNHQYVPQPPIHNAPDNTRGYKTPKTFMEYIKFSSEKIVTISKKENEMW